MREPNLGIHTSCVICGRLYWCDDGSPICASSACETQAEQDQCMECGDKAVDHISMLCQPCVEQRQQDVLEEAELVYSKMEES